jgi:hypothetical protein
VTRRGFDAVDLGKADQLMTQGKMGIVRADHIVVRLRWTAEQKVHLSSLGFTRSDTPLSTLFDFLGEGFRGSARPLAPLPPWGAKGRADSGFARDWRSHTLKPFQVRCEIH